MKNMEFKGTQEEWDALIKKSKMKKKHTAVEWLMQEIDNKDMGEIPVWIYDLCDKSLEIEKEQKLEMYLKGIKKGKKSLFKKTKKTT